MNKLLFVTIALSLVFTTWSAALACTASSGNTCSPVLTGCTTCSRYAASTDATTCTDGKRCTAATTGYTIYNASALADNSGATDDRVCSTSCLATGYCAASDPTLCYQCAAGYGAPVASYTGLASGANFTTPIACTACTGANCGSCYSATPAKCASCPAAYYPVGNTSAATTVSGATLSWSGSPDAGPASCALCNASTTLGANACISCTNTTTCLTCNTTLGYVLKSGVCVKSAATMVVQAILATVAVSMTLLL